jgi:large repetitive protein
VRLKLVAAFALVVVVGSSLLGSPAAASGSAVEPSSFRPHGTKVPWRSNHQPAIPGQIVVVWRNRASAASQRALAAQIGGAASTPVGDVQTVRVAPGTENAAIRRYQRSALVRFAEPDRLASVMAAGDTHFDQQWALDNTGQSHRITQYKGLHGDSRRGTLDADIDAPGAWAEQTVHDPVVVAVIDTGVETNHEDLQNSLWVNTSEQGGTVGTDDDGNHLVDDVNGWDFFGKDKNPSPSSGKANSHGTHVAGIIAAQRDNATGISGVCGDCQIMALRIGTASKLALSRELKAIEYAIDAGADVINFSIGGPIWSAAERSEIRRAGNAGILFVTAAGNSSLDNDIDFYDFDNGSFAPSYPASYGLDNVLTVAASNDSDRYGWASQCKGEVPIWRCGFTSWGHDSVDVAAPGVDILSTVTFDDGTFPRYDVWDGTSMASPMVAGIAGLVLSEHPGYTPVDIKNAIMNSVDEPSSLKLYTSYGRVTGVGTKLLSGRFTRTQGRVNALEALTASTNDATTETDGSIAGARTIDLRRTDRLSWPSDTNDVFKKRLVDGRRYRVTVNGPPGADFDIWVWKPGTKDIFQFTIGCFQRNGGCPALAAVSASTKADETTRFTAHKSGSYYIQVNDWYSHGRYAVKIRKI